MDKNQGKGSKSKLNLPKMEGYTNFRSLPYKGRLFLFVIFALGSPIYLIYLPRLSGPNLGVGILFGLLSAIVASKQVIDPNGRVLFSIETVVLGIVYFIGGVPTLLFASLLATGIQMLVSRKPWYVWTFNLLQVPIQFVVLDSSTRWLNAVIPLEGPFHVPSLMISFLFASMVHTGLVATVILLVNGIPIKKSNTFTFLAIFREVCFFCIALSTVMIWEIEPLAVLVTLSPVYILYSSFQLPFLKKKSEMDQKTGLFNSKAFLDSLEKEFARAIRFDRPLTLVMADLDYLRHINNTYGHLVGDRVLIEVGRTLKNIFREFDTVARFGGEEFAIILPETSREDVIHVVERARRTIAEMSITDERCDRALHVTMSFGIAQRDNMIHTGTDLIHNADLALYHAKGSGRNCIGIYKDSKVLCVTMPFSIPIEHAIDG